jgi:tripartite-type tricarboxylate transporter receptor subunit TctC
MVLRVLIAALIISFSTPSARAADDFPTRPIKILVGVEPGGPADTVMRLVAAQITEATGVAVIPDYRVGASGMRAMRAGAVAAPDGYTLVLGSVGVAAINPTYFDDIGYDVLKDFRAVSYLMTAPTILVVNSQLPVSNVKELVAYIKGSKKPFNFGSAGKGQSVHLAAEIFKHQTGLDFEVIPYNGAAPAVKDLLGGQVDAMFDTTTSVPYIHAGTLKVLAVGTAERSPLFPGVPTIAESGFGKIDVNSWYVLLAPRRTPDAIVDKLGGLAAAAMHRAENAEKLRAMNSQGIGSTPTDAQTFLEDQITAWHTMITDASIKGQ